MTRGKPFVAVVLLLLAACGGGGGGGGGGGDGEDLPRSATATSEDAEGTVYTLAPGRYRMSWDVEGCDFPEIRITDEAGEVLYDQAPRVRITFVREVPGGDVLIEQANAECTSWEIELLWQGALR